MVLAVTILSNEADQNDALQEFLEDHEFNFIFSGHNHNWFRSKQVTWSGSSTNPDVVDHTSPYSAATKGIIFVVSGGGGRNNYDQGSLPSYGAYKEDGLHGIWEIISTNNSNTWTCQFRDEGGDTHDTFVINQ